MGGATAWWVPYVGLPFVDGGRGRAGLDCWGLVRLVYADRLGVDLPSYGEISARDLMAVAREMRSGAAAERWQPVEAPAALDVVLMRSGRGGQAVVHVGVAVNGAGVLHIEPATHSVVVPLNHFSIRDRIAGFRRFLA